MAYFKCGSGGSSVEIDGESYDGDLKLKKTITNINLPNVPFIFCEGSAFVFENEIHIMGGNPTDGYTKHYKFNGNDWEEVSTAPCIPQYQSTVVYDGKIFTIRGKYYYIFDNGTWTQGTILSSADDGTVWRAKVLNNKIYALGYYSSNTYAMYFDGSTWKTFSKPTNGAGFCITIYDNSLHCLGGNKTLKNHYKYNGSTWTSISTLPYNFYSGTHAETNNNELHIFGGTSVASDAWNDVLNYHYKYNDGVWTRINDLPIKKFRQGTSETLDNGILIIGGETYLYTHNNSLATNVYPYGECGFILDKTVYEIAV